MKRFKVALVTNVIAPYRIPVFNHLFRDPSIDLKVFFERETLPWRGWRVYRDEIEFPYKVLNGFALKNKKTVISWNILPLVREGPFDAIICTGLNSLITFLILSYCKVTETRCFLWSESNFFDKRRKTSVERVKRFLVRKFDGWIAAGKTSRDYLIQLGASPEKVYIAPDAVDVEYFHNECLKARWKKEEIKSRYGLPRYVILYVGRLIDLKGIQFLLKAFRFLEISGVALLLVGDGPQKKQYEEYCQRHGISNVYFQGFHQKESLPEYYAIADIFVFPTLSDPWGLVLNEAMSCELPIISSNRAGAAWDLVVEGVNGYLYDPMDVEKLTNLMRKLLKDEPLRKMMGEKSWQIIQFYRPESWAQGVVEAILGVHNQAGNWSLMTDKERLVILNST
ncbi:MAG TPA: glycosyltransferase family 1 protein [Candidatus Atribacteria bacterium]|nr:glycosyltransferase family 1 protein [Candidatus Atribacteria bacterium]